MSDDESDVVAATGGDADASFGGGSSSSSSAESSADSGGSDSDGGERSGSKRKRPAASKPKAKAATPVSKAPTAKPATSAAKKSPAAASASASATKAGAKSAAKPAAKAGAAKPAAAKAKAPAKAAAAGAGAGDDDDDDKGDDVVFKAPPVTAASSSASAAAAAVVASIQGQKITSETHAESILLEYLNKSNRPYSPINLFDNLHGAIGKTVLVKILDKLADRGAIKSKLYGKSKLYWPDQAQYGDISEADRSEWSSRAKELESTLGGLQAQRKALQSQLTALSSSLTGPALDAQLAATQVAVAGMRERLDRLQSSTAVVVTPEQRGAVKASLLRYRKGWSTRKAMVMDVIDNMAEGLEKKPAALMESVGLETDEEAGVSIKECLP